eukprot:5871922-Pyramimonas_sp.AAC.1
MGRLLLLLGLRLRPLLLLLLPQSPSGPERLSGRPATPDSYYTACGETHSWAEARVAATALTAPLALLLFNPL